ncbi:MAG TPA: glycosyltransferase family 1 protein [bacterium]|nr:glycosyltransferase family 1 protein [bacterium]
MRIGISARGLSVVSGGAKEYIKQLISHLIKIDSSGEYFVYFDSKSYLETFSAKNLTKVVIKFPSRIIWDHVLLPIRMQRDKIDVGFFPKNVIPYLGGFKKVVGILDLAYYMPELNAYRALDTLYMKTLIPGTIRRADKVITISANTKKDIFRFIKGTREEKIEVVHLAGSYTKNYGSNRKVRRIYSIGNSPYIFFAGSLSPRKNIQRTLRALARIKEQVPHNFVVTGGKSWKDSDIPGLVSKLGLKDRMIKLGFVEDRDMGNLFAEADMYLHPTLYEGFGMTILEAFAARCPVISSNVSSIPEVAGDAAILVDPYSVDEIAAAIIKLHENKKLRTDLVKKGLRRLKKFSWEKTAKETLNVINEVYDSSKK